MGGKILSRYDLLGKHVNQWHCAEFQQNMMHIVLQIIHSVNPFTCKVYEAGILLQVGTAFKNVCNNIIVLDNIFCMWYCHVKWLPIDLGCM